MEEGGKRNAFSEVILPYMYILKIVTNKKVLSKQISS